MRPVVLRFLALFCGLAPLAAFSNFGCNAASPSDPAAPQCKSGFRNQCVDDVAVGAGFACAKLGDRSVWCWGRNDQGQLGYPTADLCPGDLGGGQTKSIACHTFPFQVVGLDNVSSLASGSAFSCAILVDGSVRCWGGNTLGELGNGSTLTSQSPVAVTSLAATTALAAGEHHACALASGQVWCWGANDHGQLGVATTTTCDGGGGKVPCSKTPVVIPDLTSVVELTAGATHTCARTSDGQITCWGDNRWGQLGVGDASSVPPGVLRTVHVTVDTPLDATLSISAGAAHTCALRDGGAVYCWGRGDHRELGAPPVGSGAVGCKDPCSMLAVEVAGLPSTGVAGEDAGADATTDVGAPDEGIDTGKERDSGADARGDTTGDVASSDAELDASIDDAGDSSTPMDSGSHLGAFGRVVSSGESFSCLRVDDGTVRCWGLDTVGQLGDGRTTSEPSAPALVIASPGAEAHNPLQGVSRVRAGASSACAILSDSSLRCWGSNQGGALGVGHFTPQQGPVPVSW